MIISNAPQHKRVIFHGNSLFNLTSGSLVENGRYCETKLYQTLIASKSKLSAIFFSVSGNPTATKIANWTTQTLPVIKPSDVIILWEIQNDVSAGGLTGQQAYDNLVTFCGLARQAGVKTVVGSATARNHTLDTDQFTRNSACNTLLRADSSFCDLFVDIGAQSGFATQADCLGANYQSDRLHHSTVGSDAVAAYFATQILNSGLL